jgi:predicted metalloprotease with PDZ domain
MGGASSVIKYCDVGAYQLTTVHADSPGETAGLHPKVDFILSMNGKKLSEADESTICDLVKVSTKDLKYGDRWCV